MKDNQYNSAPSEKAINDEAPSIFIRSYRDRHAFKDVEECKRQLYRDFMNESVSLEIERSSGMKALLFVDVRDTGLFESYADQRPVDLDAWVQ